MSTPVDWTDPDLVIEVPDTAVPVIDVPSPSNVEVLVVQGKDGAGLEIDGAVDTYTDLPTLTADDMGQVWAVNSAGKLYTWSGTAWPIEANGIQIRGQQGLAGRGVESVSLSGNDLAFLMSDDTTETVTVPAIEAASTAASAAAASASAAAGSASGAAGSATAAHTSETNSAGSASSAAGSATTAGSSATAAATSETNAAGSATAAATAQTAAAGSATAASGSASSAGSAATAAAGSASAAHASELSAATSATNAATSESQAATSASNAHTSETNAAASAADAAQSAEDAADVVNSGIPNADNDTKGGIMLAGDLGGTYDAPTVPGLANVAHRTGDETIAGAKTFTGPMRVEQEWSALDLVNVLSDQYSAAGFKLYGDASTLAGAAGVQVVVGIADAGATQAYFEIATVDRAGDFLAALAQFDLATKALNLQGNLNVGGHRVVSLADGASSTDAATKGQMDTGLAGKADLVGGKVPTSQIPAIALVTTQVVASTAARLALTDVQPGDVAIQTGNPGRGTYMLAADDPSVDANWILQVAPTDAVSSVNGYQGIVVLAKGDIGLGSVDNTADTAKSVASAAKLTTARALRTNLASTATASFDGSGDATPGVTGALPVANGGTGATDAATARTNLGAAAAADLTAAQLMAINAQTASYTLVLADQNKAVEITSASATTLTVPANSSVAFPVGTLIEVLQCGAGAITLAAASGVTINGKTGTTAQWGAVILRKRGTDLWVAL